MRRIAVEEPENVEETSSPRARRRASPAQKAVRGEGSPVSYPSDAAFWSIRNEANEKLGSFGDEGAMIFEWPVAELSVATIRERWGAGAFTLYFQNLRGQSRSRKHVTIAGAAKEAKAPRVEVVATSTALTPGDPMERALQLMGAIDGYASRKAAETIAMQSDFLKSAQVSTVQLFQAAMGNRVQEAKLAQAALPEQLEKVLVSFSQRLAHIEEQLADDDGDEDDEDDEGAPDRTGVPSLPEQWNGIGDMLYRVLMRQVPALEKALPGLLDQFLANLQAKAAEAHAAAAAANGAAPSVIDVPGVVAS